MQVTINSLLKTSMMGNITQ